MSTPDSDKKSPIDALTPVSAALVEFQAEARVPTEHGSFTMKLFREEGTGREHIAMVMGDVKGSALVRVHSECMTGDVFGSLRCDCGPQLQFAMSEIGKKGSGVVVYLAQVEFDLDLSPGQLRAIYVQRVVASIASVRPSLPAATLVQKDHMVMPHCRGRESGHHLSPLCRQSVLCAGGGGSALPPRPEGHRG